MTEEQQDLIRLVRDFVKREVLPNVEKDEEKGEFQRHLIRKMGELGLYGLGFPEKYGGGEAGFLAQCLVIEEVTRASIPLGMSFNVQAMVVPACIYYWGNEEQKMAYLPSLFKGELVGCFSLTEPNAGSDAGAISTRAKRVNGGYLLNGTKSWATYGVDADFAVIMAKTQPDLKHKGISAFIVDFRKVTNVTRRPIPASTGTRCVHSAEIFLEDTFVPEESLLGREGEGFAVALSSLDYGRLTVASRCLGAARAALDASVRYANQREAFGQQIGRYQMIQHLIADVVSGYEAAKLLVYRAAFLADTGAPFTREAAIAKYFAADVAKKAAEAAVEIHGAYGVADEYPIHRLLEFSTLMRTVEGAPNIQRLIIAQDALGYKMANRYPRK
ncbi:acyl-CoA dehydrogenase family protein [Desulfofundulus thermocisternus]|uniref:acyl-CoA dehydrogenase family protein n=1 Tax=Desulfofundulus thermocisternus TaxID=42471 RepID=UPI00217D121A|nr:acyl-CoA dehydrogenase family protein [Desulfofundulus thermocisternus]MCS5694708.1 acyl-CoA dehydrogenase family protein [Desulfofundulus thermocisternus]